MGLAKQAREFLNILPVMGVRSPKEFTYCHLYLQPYLLSPAISGRHVIAKIAIFR
jgi:hypothetical protein